MYKYIYIKRERQREIFVHLLSLLAQIDASYLVEQVVLKPLFLFYLVICRAEQTACKYVVDAVSVPIGNCCTLRIRNVLLAIRIRLSIKPGGKPIPAHRQLDSSAARQLSAADANWQSICILVLYPATNFAQLQGKHLRVQQLPQLPPLVYQLGFRQQHNHHHHHPQSTSSSPFFGCTFCNASPRDKMMHKANISRTVSLYPHTHTHTLSSGYDNKTPRQRPVHLFNILCLSARHFQHLDSQSSTLS